MRTIAFDTELIFIERRNPEVFNKKGVKSFYSINKGDNDESIITFENDTLPKEVQNEIAQAFKDYYPA